MVRCTASIETGRSLPSRRPVPIPVARAFSVTRTRTAGVREVHEAGSSPSGRGECVVEVVQVGGGFEVGVQGVPGQSVGPPGAAEGALLVEELLSHGDALQVQFVAQLAGQPKHAIRVQGGGLGQEPDSDSGQVRACHPDTLRVHHRFSESGFDGTGRLHRQSACRDRDADSGQPRLAHHKTRRHLPGDRIDRLLDHGLVHHHPHCHQGGGLPGGGPGGVLDQFFRGLEAFPLGQAGVAQIAAGAEGDLPGYQRRAGVQQAAGFSPPRT